MSLILNPAYKVTIPDTKIDAFATQTGFAKDPSRNKEAETISQQADYRGKTFWRCGKSSKQKFTKQIFFILWSRKDYAFQKISLRLLGDLVIFVRQIFALVICRNAGHFSKQTWVSRHKSSRRAVPATFSKWAVGEVKGLAQLTSAQGTQVRILFSWV